MQQVEFNTYDESEDNERKHNSTTLMAAHLKSTRSDYIIISHVIQKYILIYAVSQHLSFCKESVLDEFLQTATEFLSEKKKQQRV